MPKMEQMERGRAIRRYFTERYAGRIQDADEAKEDLFRRFHIDQSRWRQWWRMELNRLNELHLASQEEERPLVQQPPQEDRPSEEPSPLVTISIPPDLPVEVKTLINQLLSRGEELQEMLERERTVNRASQELWLGGQRKLGFLKKLSKDLIDQL